MDNFPAYLFYKDNMKEEIRRCAHTFEDAKRYSSAMEVLGFKVKMLAEGTWQDIADKGLYFLDGNKIVKLGRKNAQIQINGKTIECYPYLDTDIIVIGERNPVTN